MIFCLKKWRHWLPHSWNAPNHLEPQFSPKVLLIFGPKNGSRWFFSTLTPPSLFSLSFLAILRVKWTKKSLEPPESPLLWCCFDSFFFKIYPVLFILPPFVPFSEYLGYYLAQSVDIPESRGWAILEPKGGGVVHKNTNQFFVALAFFGPLDNIPCFGDWWV